MRLLAAAALALLAGCPAATTPQRDVRPGAYCSPAGSTGLTADGTEMKCTTAPDDERNRWRRAT